MNLTPKNNGTEFNRFLFDEIDLYVYHYKFLKSYVDKVIEGQKPLYNTSIINTSSEGWILILHGEMLLIYGENWSKDHFQEVSEIFDLNTYTNFILSGNDELVNELISFYKPNNYEIEKRRLFYQATEIKSYQDKDLEIKLGSVSDLEELAVMLQEYYHEEYNGKNDKGIDEMRERVFSLIQTRKIYVLFNKFGVLLSFCTIIDPDIGIIFTKRDHRNRGFGKVILSYCSSLLHKRNDIVYLMTDRDSFESNMVCEKVGFIPYYQYTMTRINIK